VLRAASSFKDAIPSSARITKARHLQYVGALERLQRFGHVSELEVAEAFGVAQLPVIEPHFLRLVVHVDGQAVLAQKVVTLENNDARRKNAQGVADLADFLDIANIVGC